MARKKKVKEPGKLWEMPLEALQKQVEHLEPRFPTSGYLARLKAEIAREERTGPMDLEDWDL